MKRLTTAGFVLVLLMSSGAQAEPTTDSFDIWLDADNALVSGGGSGWDGGAWLEYPQGDPPGSEPSWWNQWFYDDPPDATRWKEISYDISLSNPGWDDVVAEVALNWSNLDFPETGPDGPPPLPIEGEPYIERHVIWSGQPPMWPPLDLVGDFVIPDYNPEWVSIDVRIIDGGAMGMGELEASGTITHECVPEPTTLSLLVFGGLLMVRRRW